LNARGTPLLASDLITNLVLQTAQQRRLDVQKLYDRYWRDFDERDYWRKDVRQGRLTRSRIDVFLFYWLVMRKAQEVGTQDVFPTFRRYLADKANEVESVLADLDRCGDTFKRLDEIPPHTDDGTFVYRWRVLDAQALTPAVLWLFDQAPDVLAPTERTRALRAISSFLVRRTICRLTTKGYNTLFLDLLTKMSEEPASAGARIEQYLREQTADARLWPSDEQLREAFLTVPVYSLLARGRLRMVLEALEDSYRSPKSESQFVERGTLTIEHILPQSWQANWPLDVAEDDTPETAALRRERLLHSIGNLTLVTGSLNTPMSNKGLPREEVTQPFMSSPPLPGLDRRDPVEGSVEPPPRARRSRSRRGSARVRQQCGSVEGAPRGVACANSAFARAGANERARRGTNRTRRRVGAVRARRAVPRRATWLTGPASLRAFGLDHELAAHPHDGQCECTPAPVVAA